MSNDSYSIFQVKEGEAARGVRFGPLERLQAAGGRVDRANYDLVYAGPLDEPGNWPTEKILAALNFEFNVNHPLDFAGRSLSISDVIVLRRNYELAAYYVDAGVGFAKVPEFLNGPYRYYSTQRPVDIGTFPKTDFGPIHIEHYDARVPVEDGRFEAWGHLDYADFLTEKQMEDYELRAAFDNPDLFRYPTRQLDAQVQVVGQWEEAQGSLAKRFTVWQPDTGRFQMKDPSVRWPVNVRYRRIVAEQERAPSIADLLKKGAAQAEKDNATRPAPDKKTDKDR